MGFSLKKSPASPASGARPTGQARSKKASKSVSLLERPGLTLQPDPNAVKNDQAWWTDRTLEPWDLVRPAAWIPGVHTLDFGGRLAQSLMAVAYPREAYNNFLQPFLRLPLSRRLSFWIEPIATEKIVHELTRRMEALTATLYAAQQRGKMADPYTPVALQDAQALRDQLAQQTIKMFDFTFLVTLFVPGADEGAQEQLRLAIQEFQRRAASSLWVFRSTTFEQATGFLSTLPIGEPGISRPRMLDSDSVAATFPFIGGDVFEAGGQFFGENLITHQPILLNLHNTKLYPAPHMIVVAKTRSGKSMTMKQYLIQQMMQPDVDVMILDPSPPIDYRTVSETMGAYIRLRPGSDQRLNVCAIAFPANIGELEDDDQKLLSKKIDYLKTLLGLMVHPRDLGQWSEDELPWIEPVIRQVYTAYGITDNPLSLIDPRTTLNMDQPQLKSMPTLSDIQQAFLQHPEPLVVKIGHALKPWIDGTMAIFNGQTNLKSSDGTSALDQRWVTFNIESITSNHPEMEQVVHFVIGEFIAQRMLATARKKIVVLDEAHILFGNRDTALWVSRLYRMAGKLNAQIILITQSISDMIGDASGTQAIPGAEFAQKCLTNTYMQLLMHADKDEELRQLQRQFSLTDAECRWLKDAGPGDGVLVSHRYHVLTHVHIPPRIYALITSNPDDLMPRSSRTAPAS